MHSIINLIYSGERKDPCEEPPGNRFLGDLIFLRKIQTLGSNY